jgi:hypothetical protein
VRQCGVNFARRITLGGLQDRQVARLCDVENAGDIVSDFAVPVCVSDRSRRRVWQPSVTTFPAIGLFGSQGGSAPLKRRREGKRSMACLSPGERADCVARPPRPLRWPVPETSVQPEYRTGRARVGAAHLPGARPPRAAESALKLGVSAMTSAGSECACAVSIAYALTLIRAVDAIY